MLFVVHAGFCVLYHVWCLEQVKYNIIELVKISINANSFYTVAMFGTFSIMNWLCGTLQQYYIFMLQTIYVLCKTLISEKCFLSYTTLVLFLKSMMIVKLFEKYHKCFKRNFISLQQVTALNQQI